MIRERINKQDWASFFIVCPFLTGALAASPSDAPASHRVQLAPLPSPAVTLHIAPTGDDAGPGSVERPFRSLERARDEVRALKAKGPLPKGGVVISVHGGEYSVERTLVLSEQDSGTEGSPVVFRAAPGEKPMFRGGVRLKGWQLLSDASALQRVPPPARGKVWQTDLRAKGVTNVLPLKLGGFASGHGFKTHPAHELFFNGKAMQLARGPNEGFLRIADVAVKDGTKGYDRQGSKIGQFFCASNVPPRWAEEPDLLLYGYWFWDWADSYERVEKIDTERRLITLAKPWHNYGFSIGAPFYAVNALCEMDAPGEWYLDRKNLRIFLFAPSEPNSATVELSLFTSPMLELNNVSYMRFEGLGWELGSADAIRGRAGSHCLFAGCTVRHFAGNGIAFEGGKGHGILSCDIYSMGRGGTIVTGGDRKTLTPGGHFLENCDIHDLSRIDHTYTPAVVLSGVGNRIAHNRLHDVLSSAMRVGGNDHTIEFNEIFNAVLESDDQGGADMFGNPTYRGNVYRYNYWHHIGNWRGTGENPKCGQSGIRLDDAICGTLIFGNIFERCAAGKIGFGAVQIHGGKENLVENNLFVDCTAAVSFTPWSSNRWVEFTKGSLEHKEVDRALYLQRYPQLAQLAENPNTNRVCRNLTLRCGELLRRGHKAVAAVDNIALSEGELSLKADNPIFNRPGFRRIPVQEIGLYKDTWRSSLPPR